MTTPNWYCLRRDVYEGEIDGITLVWGDSSKRRIKENARNLDVTLETVKAVTEHFIFLCAQRLHRGKAVILGAPHSFTKNSGADGEVYPDLEHVSARLSRRLYPNEENITGQDKVHVYLTGMVDGSARYNSARMEGERVTKMKSSGDVLDQSRSTGTYPLNPGSSTQTSSSDYATGSSSSAGYSAAGLSSSSGYAATGYTPATGYTATSYTSTTGYTPTTTAGYTTTAYTPTTTAGYTVTTASSSGTGGAGGTTQWEWSSKYGRYYRYVNGEVEWGSGSHV